MTPAYTACQTPSAVGSQRLAPPNIPRPGAWNWGSQNGLVRARKATCVFVLLESLMVQCA